jgi:hypothetical protein
LEKQTCWKNRRAGKKDVLEEYLAADPLNPHKLYMALPENQLAAMITAYQPPELWLGSTTTHQFVLLSIHPHISSFRHSSVYPSIHPYLTV